jgi:hypothetical protein
MRLQKQLHELGGIRNLPNNFLSFLGRRLSFILMAGNTYQKHHNPDL